MNDDNEGFRLPEEYNNNNPMTDTQSSSNNDKQTVSGDDLDELCITEESESATAAADGEESTAVADNSPGCGASKNEHVETASSKKTSPATAARANNANSQQSSNNWIDRKTRPATGGERRRPSAGDRGPPPQQVGTGSRSRAALADGNIRRSGYSPWTPANSRSGQTRTMLVSDKINENDITMNNVVKDDDYDVAKVDHSQESIKEKQDKDNSSEYFVPAAAAAARQQPQPGAMDIPGIHPQPSTQSTLVANHDATENTDAPGVDADLDAPLVAHLVEENHEQPEYHNIVVAVEADNEGDKDPRRQRRQRLLVAALIVVAIVLGIVLGMTLTNKTTPTTNDEEEEEEPDLWYNVVDPMDGDVEDGEFGSSVSMCSDGSRVAIGAQGSGQVKVFELNVVYEGSSSTAGYTKQIGQTFNHSFITDMSSSALQALNTSIIRSRIVVELSSNCQVLAIGSPLSNVDNKTMAGKVILYKYQSTSDSWEQLGNIITGDDDSDLSGAALALSQTGDRIAIGSPGNGWAGEDAGQVRVFYINLDRWELLGMPLNGTFPGEEFGGSVSLANKQSSATSIIAVGSSSKKTIHDTYGEIDPESAVAVRVFELETGDWQQRGQGIVPDVLSVDTAWFAKLSSDGLKLVVSNLYLDPDGIGINEDNEGLYVAAFELDEQDKEWVPRGGNIHRNFPGKKSGYTISLSENGERIGMGDPGKEGAGGLSGHAHFYEFNGQEWCQLGPDIDGYAAGDMAGYSVSLSGDGTRMVIASPKSRALGSERGRVWVVELHEDRIVPKCQGISFHSSHL